MSPIEQLARYGVYISVMTEREQILLAEGKLRPSVIQVCGWCERLTKREKELERRFSEAMKDTEKPLKNRNEKIEDL